MSTRKNDNFPSSPSITPKRPTNTRYQIPHNAQLSSRPVTPLKPVLDTTNVININESLPQQRDNQVLSRTSSLYDLRSATRSAVTSPTNASQRYRSLNEYTNHAGGSRNAYYDTNDNASIRSNVTALTTNLHQELMQSINTDNLSLYDYYGEEPQLHPLPITQTHAGSMRLQFDEDIQEDDISSFTGEDEADEQDTMQRLPVPSITPMFSSSRLDQENAHLNNADFLPELTLPDLDSHRANFVSHTPYTDKNFFILTSAGKPIFSMKHDIILNEENDDVNMNDDSQNNQDELYGLSGIINTIVEFFKIKKQCNLNSFEIKKAAGNGKVKTCKFVFLDKSPVVLMAYSELEYESELHLSDQLDFLYSFLLSILSKNKLDRLFDKRENFDLRNFLTDLDFQKMVDVTKQICFQFHPQFLFYQSSSLQIYPMKKGFRTALHRLMLNTYMKSLGFKDELITNNGPINASSTLLYGMIVSFPSTQLVSILRPKSHSLHTTDLHLLFQLIKTQYFLNQEGANKENGDKKDMFVTDENTATKMGDTYFYQPICFPKFNSNGFLYCYIKFFHNDAFAHNSLESSLESTFATVLICSKKQALPYCQHLDNLIQQAIIQETTTGKYKKLFTTTDKDNEVVSTNGEAGVTRNGLMSMDSRWSTYASHPYNNVQQVNGMSKNAIQYPELPHVYHFIYKSKPLVQHITPTISENLMHYYLFLQSQALDSDQQPLDKKSTLIAAKITVSGAGNEESGGTIATPTTMSENDSHNNNSHNNNSHNNNSHNNNSYNNQTIMGICWITKNFEFYLLGNPNYNNKKELLMSSKKIIQWCYKNEQRMFIHDGAVF